MHELFINCSQLLSQSGNMLLTALVAGIASGAVHCSTMCGPMLAMQRMAQPQAPEYFLLSHHAGRLMVYALLGTIAAIGSAWLFGNAAFTKISGIILLVAGAGFMLSAAFKKAPSGCSASACRCATKPPQTARNAYLGWITRGAVVGFMPCGIKLGALLLAGASQEPLTGAAVMLSFGIGTLPMLHLFGMGGQWIMLKHRLRAALFGRGLATLNGLMLMAFGLHVL